jgi:hypothetical protein
LALQDIPAKKECPENTVIDDLYQVFMPKIFVNDCAVFCLHFVNVGGGYMYI